MENKTVLFFLLCCLSILQLGQGIWLNLPASGTKCVSEEIQTNVVVLADYTVISEDHQNMQTISTKVITISDLFSKSLFEFIVIFDLSFLVRV